MRHPACPSADGPGLGRPRARAPERLPMASFARAVRYPSAVKCVVSDHVHVRLGRAVLQPPERRETT